MVSFSTIYAFIVWFTDPTPHVTATIICMKSGTQLSITDLFFQEYNMRNNIGYDTVFKECIPDHNLSWIVHAMKYKLVV